MGPAKKKGSKILASELDDDLLDQLLEDRGIDVKELDVQQESKKALKKRLAEERLKEGKAADEVSKEEVSKEEISKEEISKEISSEEISNKKKKGKPSAMAVALQERLAARKQLEEEERLLMEATAKEMERLAVAKEEREVLLRLEREAKRTNEAAERKQQKLKEKQDLARARLGLEGAGPGHVISQAAPVPEVALASPSREEVVAKARRGEDLDVEHEAEGKLRSPICCILGHVDTGKTKLLDRIRNTNVQLGEAGGITQQIGATFLPSELVRDEVVHIFPDLVIEVPGLLIIDTPGHESFNNLRARGSSLCDIAILVIDIMHGIEPQTLESLRLLKDRKCPFIVALNKVDRLYGWAGASDLATKQSSRGAGKISAGASNRVDRSKNYFFSFKDIYQEETAAVKEQFELKLAFIQTQLAEQGFNSDLYYHIADPRKNISIVPTSALTGDGILDLLAVLMNLTQKYLKNRIDKTDKGFQATILEVKQSEGLGTTLDCILTNGVLSEGDQFVTAGFNGPVVAVAKALFIPHPLKEMRAKDEFLKKKRVHAAFGVKISAVGIDDVISGSPLIKVNNPGELERAKELVQIEVNDIFKRVQKKDLGCYVSASSLGSLEALLMFLNSSNIPVCQISVGSVTELDVKKASVAKEKGHPEFACILAFDVKVSADAQKSADSLGVDIYQADIIYHLFDRFEARLKLFKEKKIKEMAGKAIYPCTLKVIPQFIFNRKDPIICGVEVTDGVLKTGTPLSCLDKPEIRIGTVESLELNKKTVGEAKKGQQVCIRISGNPNISLDRTFTPQDILCSTLTRDSIDALKSIDMETVKIHAKLIVAIKRKLKIV